MTPALDFLLVGAGRSGTSLLTALLDQHSALTVGFEVGGTGGLRGRSILERSGRVLEDRIEAFLHACSEAAAAAPTPRWGNKITTEQLAGLNRHNLHQALRGEPAEAILEAFFNRALARVPVIYLMRDGRACVDSKMRRAGQDLAQACDNWLYAVEVHDFLRGRDKTLFLRFEDLVANPRGELTRVLDFLGLTFESAQLSEQGTAHPSMPAAYRRAGIEADRAAAPAADHPALPRIGAALRRCGYLPADDDEKVFRQALDSPGRPL